MLRKSSYWYLLLLSILLWGMAAWRHAIVHSFTPQQGANAITRNLEQQGKSLHRFLDNYPEIINRAANKALTQDDAAKLNKLETAIFIYKNDSLKYWNTSSTLPYSPPYVYTDTGKLVRQDGNVYWARRLQPLKDSRNILVVALYPIAIYYPFENDYLVSHFIATTRIPSRTPISDTPTNGSPAFKDEAGTTAGYLLLSPENATIHAPDDLATIFGLIGTIILGIWLHAVTKNSNSALTITIVVSLTIIMRLLLYWKGLPFELSELPLFSPQLYASSKVLPSLGDLFLNALLLIWIVDILSNKVQWAAIKRIKNPSIKLLLSGVFALALVAFAWGSVAIISTIVLNSHISFDVAHFYAIDAETVAGLITISVVIIATALVIKLLANGLTALIPKYWMKYAAIIAAGILFYFTRLASNDHLLYQVFLGWVVLLIACADIPQLKLHKQFFSTSLLFWMVFFCASATGLLQYYNDLHEQDTRKNFAEHLLTRRDDPMEWAFTGISQRMASDTTILALLLHPSGEARRSFNDRFNALYLNNELNNYAAYIYLFDANGRSLNEDTTSFKSLSEREVAAIPSAATDLYYIENAADDHDYLAHIQIKNRSSEVVAHLFIDLAHKKTASETVLPELLQPSIINKAQKEAPYHYAIYSRGRLVSGSVDYPFPAYLNIQPGMHSEWEWKETDRISALRYRPEAGREALVVLVNNKLLSAFTLFSYLFGIQLLACMIVVLYRNTIRWVLRNRGNSRINVTLRQRIQASMLGIVLLSFLIIAVTTVAFFRHRYEEDTRQTVLTSLQRTERSINQYLSDRGAEDIPLAQVGSSLDFRKYIADLARTQQADINLYDASGILAATSQEDIYSKGIMAPIMRPQAFVTMRDTRQSVLIRDEQVGNLVYTSSYVPMLQPGGGVYGYLNIPFFSSRKEVDAQVSNILIALINLYAFIFLISSLLALFTTGWLTRTLSVITAQFNRLNLKGNELLLWPYDDEIGLMVKGYNKMVRKLEVSAVLLAQSEREGAWREMARQVAHEIKNPLTPMKLNLQHLQGAIKNNHPDITALTKRVADSMLEQIDNLSYIASEFSSFAALPEAKPEPVVLNDLLEKITALYTNEPRIDVSLSLPNEPITVQIDRSQINRICTNLLQNSVQAIPLDERQGKIEISLSVTDGEALILVKDNGEGITDEVAERLFQPYFTTKSSGTGLGLAMTRKMVELWKGSITFETEVGVGTTFFVRLPLP